MKTRLAWLMMGALAATLVSSAWGNQAESPPQAVQSKTLDSITARYKARDYVKEHAYVPDIESHFEDINYGQDSDPYDPCKRSSKHKITCRVSWSRHATQGRADVVVKMKHKRDAFGKASYPISVAPK